MTSVRHAEALPEPAIGARVTGRGHNRSLYYVHAPQSGEKVTFVERGPQTQQTLGVAKAGRCPEGITGPTAGRAFKCGRVRFRPGLGRRGVREILAVVEQDGAPRKTTTVARYTAPAPIAPSAPRGLKLARKGSKVRITWNRARASSEYNVVVRTSDGRRELFIRPGNRRAVTVRGVTRRTGISVSVRGLRVDRVEGPAAQGRLGAGQKKFPKPPRKRGRR